MYTKPQTTLPPITAIGNGIVGNGEMLQNHVKQEQEFEQSPPSLPPIRTPNNHNESNNNSRMSINQLCNETESDYPEEMKEAAQVLENMKTSIANISQSQPQPLEPRAHAEPSNTTPAEPGFMSRLGGISIVKRAYEHIVDQYARSYTTTTTTNDDGGKFVIEKNDDPLVVGGGQSENDLRKRKVMGSRSSSPSYRNSSRSHRSSQSSGSSNSSSYAPYNYPVSASTSASTTQNRWKQMVIGPVAAFGAAGAAVSEESMKSLKYCLQWINYATQHIDAQIMVLREFIVSLTSPSESREVIPSSTTLSSIKKEVIETLRKVIEVVSKYAGACLPDQARRNVRSFILNLPSRWASINHTEHSTTTSPLSSPQLAPAKTHPLNQTTDYAKRLLSLATESLDMLRSVAGIFGETVVRAESWIESLKVVGFTAGGANAMGNTHFDSTWPTQPNGFNTYSSSNPPSHSSSGRSSRRSSNSARMSNHGPRKHSRPTPPVYDDDDDNNNILNGQDSDTSSDSEVESIRMEMDTAQKRALKSATKKRKKVGKKEADRMDLS